MVIYRSIIGVLFLGVALMNLVAPRLMWRARSWQYKNRQALEPSRAGYTAQRIFGAVALVVGVVVFFVLPWKH